MPTKIETDTPKPPPKPLTVVQRLTRYYHQNGTHSKTTARQRRRIRHKANHAKAVARRKAGR